VPNRLVVLLEILSMEILSKKDKLRNIFRLIEFSGCIFKKHHLGLVICSLGLASHLISSSSTTHELPACLRWGCPNIDEGYTVNPEDKIFLSDRMRENITQWNCDFKILGTEYLHYGHHVPYDAEFWKGAVVTMFRSPISRLISAFLFADGVMIPRGFYNYDLEVQVRMNVTQSRHPIHAYAMVPGISQCQAKMVMGYDCGNDVAPFNIKQMKEIHRRLLEDFLFFGLQEESKATYELFIAMFGIGHLNDTSVVKRGLPPPYKLIYRQGYVEGGERVGERKREELREELRSLRWSDKADEHVYEVAKRIFYKRCREYRIETKYGKGGGTGAGEASKGRRSR
jgi:hypothetical protein